MNISTQNHQSVHTGHGSRNLLGSLLLGALLVPTPFTAGAADSFQIKALLAPGKSILQAESRGRVMIYDGLDEEVVDRALDEQFDRIEHMMFIRIHRAGPGGTVSVEDDGC
jgi:hypothetical protein